LVNALKLKLEHYFRDDVRKSPDKESEFNNIGYLIKNISEKIRNATLTIKADLVKDFGLAVALENLGREFSLIRAVKVRFEVHGAHKPLPKPLELELYRIGVEMLEFATMHNQPKNIFLRLSYSDLDVKLVLSDEGKVSRQGGDSARILENIKNRIYLTRGGTFLVGGPGEHNRLTAVFSFENELLGEPLN
jgi:signal transduction histidine kinase